MELTSETRQRAEAWLDPLYDEATRKAVQGMLETNPQLTEDSFYKDLSFGTGGLRGEMGVGSNRMNSYTVSMATQGLADYLKEQFDGEIRVAIAYDSRNRSPEFAQVAADVLSANGIDVYLFSELRPTPLLSYTVRELGCQSGIVITASHNPKEYNGYKVYWSDGGQLVPPHDSGVIGKVNLVKDPSAVKKLSDKRRIHDVPVAVEASYYEKLLGLLRMPIDSPIKNELQIVYTSLHGTGITMIPQALNKAGFGSVEILASQKEPDGDFPTVASPNPEETTAMAQALEQAETLNADIILGTDPDTDRVGMGIKGPSGMQLLNGNQAAALLLHFLLENTEHAEKARGFVAKTIVTTELLRAIADGHSVKCYDTLTGFKYIAELIRNKEGEANFIGGGEESYGYLVGDFVRDKDAVISSVMLCEMAAWCRTQGKTVHEMLIDIYRKYGLYRESLVSLVKKGKQGAQEITDIMEGYRTNPIQEIAGISVRLIADYSASTMTSLERNETEAIDLPRSNVIQFFLADGSKITARPSGTEPKIKYYISVRSELGHGDYNYAWAEAREKIKAIESALGI